MERYNSTTSIIWRVACLLLFLVLLTLRLGVRLPARYSSEASGEDSVRVAQFATDTQIKWFFFDGADETSKNGGSDWTNNLTQAAYPDGDHQFAVKLFNHNANKAADDPEKKSEVTVQYTVKFTTTGNTPIKIKVYDRHWDDANKVDLTTDNNTYTGKIDMTKSEANLYCLIVWPDEAGNDDWRYASEIDAITITVDFEQVD